MFIKNKNINNNKAYISKDLYKGLLINKYIFSLIVEELKNGT